MTDSTWSKTHKKFNYTTITDRLKTVRWGDNSHPIGVANLMFKGLNFPLPLTVVQSKEKH